MNKWLRMMFCAAAVTLFLADCASFYLPGRGFTYVVVFGEKSAPRYLPALRRINHFETHGSQGYDAQYYAQIAMDPRLGDPALQRALDDVPYRARRILFPLAAYALAGGEPARALNLYAVENMAAWLVLAGVLFLWLPPASSWGNVFRWAAVMFSLGLCSSVGRALVDGPSLCLIALALAWAERSGAAAGPAGVLALAGLGRETNLLALPALWRRGRTPLLLAAVLPTAAWMAYLAARFGAGTAGERNFAWPLVGYAHNVVNTWILLRSGNVAATAPRSAFVLVALTVQAGFFFLRPRWPDAWWRLGAAYAALMVVLGDAVWEGYPAAVSRVLLPIIRSPTRSESGLHSQSRD